MDNTVTLARLDIQIDSNTLMIECFHEKETFKEKLYEQVSDKAFAL